MAINDIDHVFHVIYEKFAENQKDKKYEDRIYIGEDEFIHDLKEFVKKSEVEDKGLLISEIYRSVSEDALEISSDGKITVSPKVLKKVENKILERKERETQINTKQAVEEESKIIDISKVSIIDISYKQYQELSEGEKIEILAKVFDNDYRKAEAARNLGKRIIPKDEKEKKKIQEQRRKEIFGEDSADTVTSPMKESVDKLCSETENILNKLLEGDLGKIFGHKGRVNDFLLGITTDLINQNPSLELSQIMEIALQNCDYSSERNAEILDITDKMKIDKQDLKVLMNLLLEAQKRNDELGEIYASSKELTPEEYEKKCKDVELLSEMFKDIEPLIQSGKYQGKTSGIEQILGKIQSITTIEEEKTQESVDRIRKIARYEETIRTGKKSDEELSEKDKKALDRRKSLRFASNLKPKSMNVGKSKVLNNISAISGITDRVVNIEKKLFESDFGKVFVYDGNFDAMFFSTVMQDVGDNEILNLPYLIYSAAKKVEIDPQRVQYMMKFVSHMNSTDLRNQMLLYAETRNLIENLNASMDDLSKMSPEKLEEIKSIVNKLESIQKVNDDTKKRGEEPLINDVDEKKVLTEEEAVQNGIEEVSLDDVQIAEFELDSFSEMFEDIQLEAMDEPVVEDETVDLESSSGPEVIAENNSVIHAETIDVAQPEEKVVQQVEEQAVEENVRNDIQSNLPKELTWVDRVKQGLFKVGKTISNVIKAVTDKNSSKGLFERIADAINSDNNSTSDSSSTSGTSSSAGPSVDEKPIQAPVDYLNTQFKVDVKLAAETAKAASEKQAQRRDASSELTQDEEQL